jgi:hypothetical protein
MLHGHFDPTQLDEQVVVLVNRLKIEVEFHHAFPGAVVLAGLTAEAMPVPSM